MKITFKPKCELCSNFEKPDKYFNIFEVYLTLNGKTCLIYEFINRFLKNKLVKPESSKDNLFICNSCCTELETSIKFSSKLLKLESQKSALPEFPKEPVKKGCLKPNLILTNRVRNIATKASETPRKRNFVDGSGEEAGNQDKKQKFEEEISRL